MPSLVFAELKEHTVRLRAENALAQGRLVIEDPLPGEIAAVHACADLQGVGRLSEADVALVALAFQWQEEKRLFTVMTDDYSIQNLLKAKGIGFQGIAVKPIERVKAFSLVCTGCGKPYKTGFKGSSCVDCGAPLKARSTSKKT